MDDSTRTAVVTGASSGIDRATAIALADAGYHVTLGARREDRLRDVATETGGRAMYLDAVDRKSIAAFAAACRTLAS